MGDQRQRRLRVGIIGSGIAGAVSAYHVRQHFGPEADVLVLEREPRVGGRVAETTVAGLRVETGATLIHSSNREVVGAVERLGLRLKGGALDGRGRSAAPKRRVGIWDGRRIILEPGGGAITLVRMLGRYGPSLVRAQRATREMVQSLSRVYEDLARGEAFDSPEALLRHLRLYDLTQVDAYTFFRRRGIGERFAREVSDPIARANYNQDGRMNALVTLVSLAGGGLGGGHLFAVAEGNLRVIEGLLERAGADVRTGDPVRRVDAVSGHGAAGDGHAAGRTGGGDQASPGAYRLVTASGTVEVCHAVILAVPLEFADLEFGGIDLPAAAQVRRPYQKTYTTLVAGRLRPEFFGWHHQAGGAPRGGNTGADTAAPAPAYVILTMERDDLPLSALGWQGPTPDGRLAVYRVFSREPLEDELLDRLRGEPGVVEDVIGEGLGLRRHARWDGRPPAEQGRAQLPGGRP
ncbi:MAG TPA: FAD-dependent oxidoreductase, partial [Bacillota bacterium]